MLISIPCHIFCSGKRLPIPAARPYLSVYSKCPPPPPPPSMTPPDNEGKVKIPSCIGKY